MNRYNLWVTIDDHSKVMCYGSLSEMNDLAFDGFFLSSVGGDVHVLPDGDEPESSLLQCTPPQQ